MGPRNKNHPDHVLYDRYNAIKQRCSNSNHSGYRYYGARGINLCDEWRESPYAFINWARSNGFRKELEIDRKDNDGDYSPDNCRFVTHKVNCNNKRFDAGRDVCRRPSKKSDLPVGVFKGKMKGTFYPRISINKKKFHLGSFNDCNEAAKEYRRAARFYKKNKTIDGYDFKRGYLQRRKLPIGVQKRENDRYQAYIDRNKKRKWLGTFQTVEEAKTAINKEKKQRNKK